MKNRVFLFAGFIFILTAGLVFSQPAVAQASFIRWSWGGDQGHATVLHHNQKRHPKQVRHDNHRRYNRYPRGHYSYHPRSVRQVVFTIPYGYVSLTVGGRQYHYHEGVYYHMGDHGLYSVAAPIGACIARLPFGYDSVYVNGQKYYLYQGTYYRRVDRGYEVIPVPREHIYSTHKDKNSGSKYVSNDNVFTVNVPNQDGSYSEVLITRKGAGFVGPQGEFYNTFPKIQQLQVMYGS